MKYSRWGRNARLDLETSQILYYNFYISIYYIFIDIIWPQPPELWLLADAQRGHKGNNARF